MADDKMKNDELDRKLGGAGNEKGYGQQSPGRSEQDDDAPGQKGGGRGTAGRDFDHDDMDSSAGGRETQTGKQNDPRGQNR